MLHRTSNGRNFRTMNIHGCWILETCTISFSDNRPERHPFQKGMISYHPNGYMQACLSVHPPIKLSTNDLEKGFALSIDEKARCFDQFLSYAGTYTVDQQCVFHHVQQSLNPSIVGQTLKREYRLQQHRLSLSYTYVVRPSLSCQYSLHWLRMKD